MFEMLLLPTRGINRSGVDLQEGICYPCRKLSGCSKSQRFMRRRDICKRLNEKAAACGYKYHRRPLHFCYSGVWLVLELKAAKNAAFNLYGLIPRPLGRNIFKFCERSEPVTKYPAACCGEIYLLPLTNALMFLS